VGLHAHIGSGIRHPEDYSRAFDRITPAFLLAQAAGLETRIFDFGGGFGVPTSKEFSTLEFLAYQGGVGCPSKASHPHLPATCVHPFGSFAGEKDCRSLLYLEPWRAIASSAQVLLLTIGSIKDRPGVGKWVITDGGAGTCAFPLYYECHEVVLANNVAQPPVERVRLVGPVCFASNWIYRNKVMPVLKPGDVIAVMDSGAYFLALEANFGFPRTAVMMVADRQLRIARRRETFEEMAARDIFEDTPMRAAAGKRI
jgi:diaminopimelate decarboxylase